MKTIIKLHYKSKAGLNQLSSTERKPKAFFIKIVTVMLLFFAGASASAQLGIYQFTGTGACPNQNPAVTLQPSNAVFSNFSSVNTKCKEEDNVCEHEEWNTNATIDLNEYHEFTLTANANYTLVLTSLSFTHFVKDEDAGTTLWHLRSGIDNYASDIATGSVLEATQTPSVMLPAASFGSVSSVTFRIYIVDSKDNSNEWTIDDITIYGTVEAAPNDPPDPASDSPQCTNPGVTLIATGIPPAGETWYWQTSAGGTSTANSSSTYTVTTSGTYYIRAQDNTTLLWSNGAGSNTVTVTPDVGTPVFTLGASSTRCDDATTITYTATATDNTGITYSLDAASIAAGNTINPATGAVTYITGWTSNSIITASAAGCNGPASADHTVSVNPNVETPIFTLGATSIRCKGGGTVTYTATATNTTGITYSLDAASIAGGITINAATGDVTYPGPWNGTTIITASAAGCAGPLTETHIVTTYNDVGTPVFALGNNSTRCQGAGTVTYSSTAVNSTSITYSLDAASLAGGNTINASTGEVTYAAGWSGATRITASAAGCNGPKTEKHDVTVDPSVGTPVFTLGLTSTRCQGANDVDYDATAANNTSLMYSLDAVSLAAGNTINSGSGRVNYISGWTGTSIITATATGCNGPTTATHTATTTPSVTTPVFTLGATSTRCQGAGTVTYDAVASNTTGITYSLNAAAIAGGNSINAATGDVTYAAGWSGATIITASAAGCGGPLTATHTVTITPTVGTPIFTSGATSTSCQGAGTVTYTATATNNTGLTYSLDAASLAGGNTINSSTGEVTYDVAWTGTSSITASATGCNGPSTATHTVTITPTVGTPVFTLGATSTRCQGAGIVTYAATATNTTGITYSLDATTDAFPGNSINISTGAVTYAAGWSGTSTITASAAGCNGPATATHTVTITPSVTTPVFTLGATSTRCQGAGTVSYDATASNTTGITYSLNAAAITGGNSINAATGDVTYVAAWTGATIITASAAGCNGPATATHTVTITPTVGTPIFTLGATSTRCQGAGTVTYTATATNNTGLTYSLDAASITGGNTINSSTGAVTYVAGWTGSSIITVTATGCNGPSTATHTATTTPSVTTPVFTLGATSTRCQGAGTVTYDAVASNTTGITYSLNAAAIAGGNSINAATGEVTYAAGWSGATIITASAAGCGGPLTATHTVTITPTVGTPIFTSGATSTRCQGAGTVTYTATATNNTGLTYSLDAASITGGNTINSSTGAVTYVAGWTGSSIITVTATGCNGPSTATHTVTITPTVGTPVFTLGATSTRCQGAGIVTYAATATNTTGITYSLDATTDAFPGNSINTSTGAVTYGAGWSGTSTITASAAGCNGPATATHTVTTTPTVGTPVFTLGATSTRCQGAGTVTYDATASNTTGITYSLNAAAIGAGNSINSSTGQVTYIAGWTGATIITASAAGCNGPATATHTVTITPTVGTPIFTSGATSTRCQGAGTVTYTATATNNTGLTYSLDAASITGGNTINSSTGAVTYVAGWTGSSIITVTATGCNGPSTATHTVTITPTVGIPVFTLGANSTRCQGAGIVTYAATATNATGITYSLDAATDAFPGNSINTSTGAVTYGAGWSGTSTITASAAGCNGPATATHTVTTTPTVGTPIFTSGATSTRCQGAGTVSYDATASNTTGITYTLNAAAITGGNSINSSTGQVTYAAGWTGATIITASAAGCNGPATATHTVTITPTVGTPIFTSGATSTRCQGAGTVTYTATATNNTGLTYSLDAASITGGNTINSSTGAVTYVAGWTGSSIITVTATGCNGPSTATHTATTTPSVTTPVFTIGATSTRCQGAGTVTYDAVASNTTGITYSLNAAAIAGGNSINAATGDVTYAAGWTGATIITASAAGCNGPLTATHTVTITPTVGTPIFTSGATSTRCQGAGTVTYTATATNNTGLTYSLDAASITGGNTINSSTGAVTYVAGWTGSSIITVTATGCNGPSTATHTVTITPTVGTPTFTLGATSTRCQGAGIVTYAATATNTTGITYSLDAITDAFPGNSINTSTGAVTYGAGWSGTSTITASAAGCNGPATATHTVTTTPTVGTPVFTLGATSTRCQGAGTVTYDATASNTTGITYSLNAAAIGAGNSINSSTGQVTYIAGWTGATIITASAAGCNGPVTATHTVTITPTVGTPVFTLGATSTRCQGAGTVTYTATATNNTGLTYSLDAASITGGNTINSSTGAVTYVAGWTGSSIITVTATGCNGPSTATHTVTITPTVGIPVFTLGASSTRCQGAGIVTYAATATNTTGITYSLDATTDAFPGNSINTSTGAVTYAAGWSGTSTITASAAGCGGPGTSTHTVTTTPTVGIPVFTLGATSSRCFGAGTVTYTATATNNTGITYSLDAASITGGNTINAATGAVTYTAVWTGTSTITATATGCNGPRNSTHVVTINPAVTTPVFTLGASTTRCQGAATVTYTATASNTTGITYNLDAASIAGGNTINSLTGAVTYAAGWSGTTTITASAAGCNGPLTATHTVTITPTVGTPVFVLGASSSRCFGAQTINYSATATNNTGITYSLDVLSILAGCTINAATGNVTYSGFYFGNSIITASATGCNGPRTATHTVSVTPSVGSPVFTLGATSTRCQGAGTVTYTATAINTTGITYSVDAASLAGGNTINSFTGAVTYTAAWSGTTIVTASAAGCNGPLTSTHTVTITPTVGIPVFTLGANSTRCQGANIVTYTATSTNSTGITYTLDAASLAAGNTINSASGAVVYTAGWTGTSTITATAAGCNGPVTGSHIANTTPTVGTPVFTLGATSTRCQGAGSVTYAATATNATGITYSLDAASIAGGNTINSSTGIVTYAATWSGTSTITASAAGCNGPNTAIHTVTITANVTTPVFLLGSVSTRLQGAGTVTYTATASNSTGITYTLDAASIAGGNTINSSTGQVTYSATWGSITIITASAAGCGGPKTATHTVMINSNTVVKQLYLSDPAQALDRVDPVNTTDVTTASTGLLSTGGTTFTTFTMAPVLCSPLTIKAGTISVKNYITISSGTMPANPAITALLQYGATTIITLSNPTYAGGILTWTGVLGADVTVPAGQAISLRITTAEPVVIFRIDFDSQTKPSKIDLPVSTYITITSLDVYSAAYPGGIPIYTAVGGTIKYIRAAVTDPFGTADITALNITITPPGSTVAAASVATAGCTRTYEYVWNTPAINGTVAILATAKEGFENSVVNTRDINFDLCTSCPPVAVNDSATGAGGTPVIVDALANDNDANNNLNPSSLSILVQPNNGSAYVSGNTVVYVPNGTFQGNDTLTYQVCDLTSPVPLCATAQIFFTIDALVIDICGDASKTHTYYIPYPEDQSFIALNASASAGNKLPTNNLRTIISIKVPYSGMVIRWDEWEDGYEANILSPVQATTKVWGDGNPFNGIAPGYGSDVIPAGGSIILDNTMNANPRNPATIYFDGKDKIVSSGQVALTQVSGEPTLMPVQAIKTNITSVYDFGQSFTVPLGEDFNSRDFLYTALFIRASEDNTTVSIDKDNNGTLETSVTLNEGQSFLLNGGVLTGATVTSDKPVGVELNAGGVDNYSIRNAPIFPATWYSHTYYTPVPTSDNAGDNPKDSSVVMFYNSLAFKTLTINWSSGAPASGTITIPPKTAIRFPLAYSTTAAYKFVNPTGESYTAIEIIDSYTPGGGGNSGLTYDWSFNLISEVRLTDYATVAWAPGGLDLIAPPGPDVNGNPIWVTPTANTTIYVKYDGIISGASGLVSPCGLKYDVSYNVNALNYIKIKDASDNNQSGIAIYTCNGAKIAAAYGADPQGSLTGVGVAYWDVGSTIQPFCKQKLLIATDDLAATLVNQPVTIPVLNNDIGFLAVVNPSSVSTLGLLQPSHGTVSINADGTVLYIPNNGFAGVDSFEYNVCSTPSPIVCDVALVVVNISSCPSTGNQNIISGQIFIDRNNDALNNDGGTGLAGIKVLLYTDGNCNAAIDANELTDSVTVDSSGYYQFIKYPEKIVEDNFDNGSGGGTCANGSDGDSPWASNWTDAGDGSVGYCQGAANPDAEITRDGVFGFGLRLKDNNVSATRSVNLNGAIKAFLTFSYRRKSATLIAGEDISVQASSDGSTFFTIYTIAGNGTADANYLTVYNQDISGYATANTAIRFLTNNNVDDQDTVYIDNVAIRFLKYPQCFITRIDPASVPAGYTITTPSQQTLTFTNGGTCSSQFDFGFKKPNITISGSVRNDKNGVKDGLITGPKISTLSGTVIYAYLTDFSGNVAFKTTVNASGDFSFPLAEINADYTLILSTISVSPGAAPPASSGCPATWGSAGDSYGINNLLGTGLEAGTPDGAIAIKTGVSNVTNAEFGFQRIPNSDNYIASVNHPAMNQLITLNGGANPPVLSGTDPEDCVSGCVLTARDVIIDTIPNNAELYYNNALITNGQLISNFDPNLLQVRVTAATLGDTTITFNYSFVDDAVMKDPTPASYKLIWLVPLPAKGLTASANLNDNTATIKWFTLSEQNTSHFVVERKYGNADFTATGNQVRAAGNSDSKRDYQMPDNISNLMQNEVIYYRIKLVDLDGKITYSNIVIIRLSKKPGVTIWPNPFQSSLTIGITTEKETNVDIKLIDVNGKLIRNFSQKVAKGISQIAVQDLAQLPAGVYLIEITDKNAGTTYQKLLKNNR